MLPPYLITGLIVMAVGVMPFVVMLLAYGAAMKGTGYNRVLLGAMLGTGLGGLVGGTATGVLFSFFEAPTADYSKLGFAVGGLAAFGGFLLFHLMVAGRDPALKPAFFPTFFLAALACTSPLLPLVLIGYPLAWIVKRKARDRPSPRHSDEPQQPDNSR
jgi:hypothetical protein